MKFIFLTLILLIQLPDADAQDGKIISKELMELPDTMLHRMAAMDSTVVKDLEKVFIYRITYLSNGLKIIGFVAEPKQKSKYPCIIANRGGRWNFSLWKPYYVAYYLGRMASWGYVVVASQYRGSSDGGEGKEEYGGKDLNDVFNLLPVLAQLPNADTSRIGMYGQSRGGMMTYLALKRSCRFKAAVVIAGLADAFDAIQKRPELEDRTFRDLIPDYDKNKEAALKSRSAVFWADEMCKSTPILLMQGTADPNVDASQSLRLVDKLYQYKHPVRFILYEGADHFITQYEKEMFLECKRYFDFYVRDRGKVPG